MDAESQSTNPGTIDEELLAILCCPETKQGLRLLDSKQIRHLNALIDKGELRNKEGHVVQEKLDGGLMREDGKIVYPIRDHIPIMLIEEGIVIEGVL